MKLFCQENHTKIEDVIEPIDYDKELLEAKARLAKLKKLPISAFPKESYEQMKMTPSGPTSYSVDNKDDSIARAEANVAELEILASKDKQK